LDSVAKNTNTVVGAVGKIGASLAVLEDDEDPK